MGIDKKYLDSFRIKIDSSENVNTIKPFEEDIIVDFSYKYINQITIRTPLIPTSFFNKSDIQFITKNNPEALEKVKKEIKKRYGDIADDMPLPKNFVYPSDRRFSLVRSKRYEYRCMHESNKIYMPTFSATLENFKIIHNNFSKCNFTLSFMEAFADKISEKGNILEAKKYIRLFANDLSLIPDGNRWSKEFKPFMHQKMMLEYGIRLPYFSNLSEMGTGKTYPTIITIKELLKKGIIDKAFIIVPKTIARSVWKHQVKQYSDLSISIIDGPDKKRMEALNEDANIYITGYEMFNVLKNDILPMLDKRIMIVLDESSKIKNPKAKRSKALHKAGKLVSRKIILNGTPITQGAQDIFSQYLFLDGGETFGTSYDNFLQTYFYKPPKGWKWVIKNKEALDAISDKIYNCGLRYLKQECLDLPPKLYENREVTMNNEQWKAYESMREQMVAWIKGKEEREERIDASVVVVKLLRLSQITSGFSKNEHGDVIRFSDNPKLNELKDILQAELYNGNQIVIWARFIPDLMAIKNLCEELNISYGLLYGATKDKDRENIISEFLDRKIKIFIGQPGAGGLGIDLYTANIVVYYSNTYTLADRLQSEDRTHRKGSEVHNKVTYIDLVAQGPNGEGTIDHHIIHTVLKEKKSIADAITKDKLREILGITGSNIGLI